MVPVLEATFVRRSGRVGIYVRRDDGTTTGWDFPGSNAGLPHDLCHLVIEDELGWANGFWGLVDNGAEVSLMDNQATLVRNGRPLAEAPGVDFSGLAAAEQAVVVLTGYGLGGADLEESLSRTEAAREVLGREAAERIRVRLERLEKSWTELEDGGSLRASFPGRASSEDRSRAGI